MATILFGGKTVAEIMSERGLVSNISEELLKDIFDDYTSRIEEFERIANDIVGKLKKIKDKGIYSVYCRVKDPYELIAKIVRKTTSDCKIDTKNYLYKITDIIGVRVLYLFRSDFFEIYKEIDNLFGKFFTENIQVNALKGTEDTYRNLADAMKANVKPKDMYSSVHYIMRTESDPETRVEIQTRTIFEEGFGEIDHKLRYTGSGKDKSPNEALYVGALKNLCYQVELCNETAEMARAMFALTLKEKNEKGSKEYLDGNAIFDKITEYLINNS
ncbi:MAG: hypothetical protein FWD58_02190 [Firmicutes bacterium]|nr:hypothetical protein [Bacillota bacterium]